MRDGCTKEVPGKYGLACTQRGRKVTEKKVKGKKVRGKKMITEGKEVNGMMKYIKKKWELKKKKTRERKRKNIGVRVRLKGKVRRRGRRERKENKDEK